MDFNNSAVVIVWASNLSELNDEIDAKVEDWEDGIGDGTWRLHDIKYIDPYAAMLIFRGTDA